MPTSNDFVWSVIMFLFPPPDSGAQMLLHNVLSPDGSGHSFVEVRFDSRAQWIVVPIGSYAKVIKIPLAGKVAPIGRLLIVKDAEYTEFTKRHVKDEIFYITKAISPQANAHDAEFILTSETCSLLTDPDAERNRLISPSQFPAESLARSMGEGIAVSEINEIEIAVGTWAFIEIFEWAMSRSNHAAPFVGQARTGAIGVGILLQGSFYSAVSVGAGVVIAAASGVKIGRGIDTYITSRTGSSLGVMLYDRLHPEQESHGASTNSPGLRLQGFTDVRSTDLTVREIVMEFGGDYADSGIDASEDSWIEIEMYGKLYTYYQRGGDEKWVEAIVDIETGKIISIRTLDDSDDTSDDDSDDDDNDDDDNDDDDSDDSEDDDSDDDDSDDDDSDDDDSDDADGGRPTSPDTHDLPGWLLELQFIAQRQALLQRAWRRLTPLVNVSPDHVSAGGGVIPVHPQDGPDPNPDYESSSGGEIRPRHDGPDPVGPEGGPQGSGLDGSSQGPGPHGNPQGPGPHGNPQGPGPHGNPRPHGNPQGPNPHGNPHGSGPQGSGPHGGQVDIGGYEGPHWELLQSESGRLYWWCPGGRDPLTGQPLGHLVEEPYEWKPEPDSAKGVAVSHDAAHADLRVENLRLRRIIIELLLRISSLEEKTRA